jgi:hypothetical protein
MTKATELAMLKLRIKLDIGILRWFSNLAKILHLILCFLFQNQPVTVLKINPHVNSLKKHGSYPEFGQSIHQHFDTQ